MCEANQQPSMAGHPPHLGAGTSQPQLAGLLRLDIMEQLPLPSPAQPTHASFVQNATALPHAPAPPLPSPPPQQQLLDLLDQPGVLQGVQQALVGARTQQRHM